MQGGKPVIITECSFMIDDQMVKSDEDGIQPMYRPKDWQQVERRKSKEKKKNT